MLTRPHDRDVVFAVDHAFFYFGGPQDDGVRIVRVPKTGGAPAVVDEGRGTPARLFAADGGIWWLERLADDDARVRVASPDGSLRRVAFRGNVTDFDRDRTNGALYVAESSAGGAVIWRLTSR